MEAWGGDANYCELSSQRNIIIIIIIIIAWPAADIEATVAVCFTGEGVVWPAAEIEATVLLKNTSMAPRNLFVLGSVTSIGSSASIWQSSAPICVVSSISSCCHDQ